MNLYKHIKENLILAAKIAVVVAVTLGIGSGVNYVIAQSNWAPPTDIAPGGNIAPPVNTGDQNQFKTGALVAGTGINSNNWAFVVQNARSGFGTGLAGPQATVHVKKPDGSTSPVLRLELDTVGDVPLAPGMVLQAVNAQGDVEWGPGGGGGGGAGTGGATYTTHCSWLVSQINAEENHNNWPEEGEFGLSQFYRTTCQNPDGTGNLQPPACNGADISISTSCYPTGVTLDTAINERPDPSGTLPEAWNYMSRNATVGTCQRVCAWSALP